MFQFLLKNKKGQQVAEYALLIALVVAAVIAMQTYAQRSLQGRIRDVGLHLTNQTSAIGTTGQYEPYYLNSSYDITKDSQEQRMLDTDLDARGELSNRERATGGYQSSDYTGPNTP